MAESLSHLPPQERAKRYRELADGFEAAVRNMGNSPGFSELRAAYEKLARGWRALAAQTECSDIIPPQLANSGPSQH